MSDQTPEEIATELRDCIAELNAKIRAAAEMHLLVVLEKREVKVIDAGEVPSLNLIGVYQKIEPTPRPTPTLPQKRGHRTTS